MPKFILSALPGLLIGLIVGFGVASLGQDDDEDHGAERDRKLAKLCMAEAKKVLAAAPRPSRERTLPARGESSKKEPTDDTAASARAERSIETILKRARDEKRWTVAHGKTAQRLFPRLNPEATAALSKEILTAVESGDVAAEADAWLPEKK
jgi:hypothetical protein